MSSDPELGIDITDVMQALSAARNQSVHELVGDMRRFDPGEAMDAFHRAALPKMSFGDALTRLRALPELDAVADRVFRKRARIVTEFGTFIYAVTCEPLDGPFWVIAGVHCFPSEECDLERRTSFVLLEYDGGAALIQGDLFEAAMAPQSNGYIYPLFVYDILMEG